MALKKVCSYCGVTMSEGTEGISHGICKECLKRVREEQIKPIMHAGDT